MTTGAQKSKNALKAQFWRDSARKNGLCYQCAKRPGVAPGKQCEPCTSKAREISRRFYEKNRERNLKAVAARREKMKAAGTLHDYNRKVRLKSEYGITLEYYDRMVESQSGTCCICRERPSTGKYPILHVDHDHETGVVRGLLCDSCNRGLGFFGDSPKKLIAAAQYVGRHCRPAKF